MKKKVLGIRRYLLEIKIGVFLLGAIIILFITALSLREVSFFKGSYVVKVKFDFSEGLKPASPVRFCGVDVGEIKKVEVKEKGKKTVVYVYAKIGKGIKIPEGSRFFINSLSLFGEKYLEIIPPRNREREGFLKDGDEVEGISSVPLFNIMSSFHTTMKKLDRFIQDTEFKDSLGEIVLNIKEITEDLGDILESVKNKEGTLGRLFYDDSLYRKTEEFVDDLKAHPWKLLYKPKGSSKSRKVKSKSKLNF